MLIQATAQRSLAFRVPSGRFAEINESALIVERIDSGRADVFSQREERARLKLLHHLAADAPIEIELEMVRILAIAHQPDGIKAARVTQIGASFRRNTSGGGCV